MTLRKNKAVLVYKAVLGCCCAALLGLSACSRQQSDWESTRAANTTDAYEAFLKKYPSGEFSAQAQARAKELYEERDWQKARDADTLDSYQAFLKQYPDGKWAEEARIRVENFALAQAPSSATPVGADAVNAPGNPGAGGAGPAPTASVRAGAGAGAAATATAAAKPRAVAPASASAATSPTKVARPAKHAAAKASAAAEGSYGIQLGAFKSGAAAANQHWARLQARYPQLLTGLSPTVAPKTGATQTLYRLQALGLTEKRARALCDTLRADSQPCLPVGPGHQ
jgi:cell division septation protein DedD